jgi:hypothetical protein
MTAINPTPDLRDQLEDAADVLAFLADATQAVATDNGCCGLSDRSARGFGLILTAVERTLLETRAAL